MTGERSGDGQAGGARSEPEEPRVLGHYSLLKELGRGAQGVVFLAEDTKLHRKVALKMLSGARAQLEDVRQRFEREAALASKLEHPGICGIHEFGEVNGIPFIAMQFLPGIPLSDLIAEASGKAPESDGRDHDGSEIDSGTSLTGKDSMQGILEIVEKTARALHAAHEVGLLHRDIKPANIMITAEGQPVILDFGLARDVEDAGHTLTESGQALGTPAYMAAEQIRGDRSSVDRRTDVYALGVTLYECLTLRRPFEAQSFEELYNQILQGAPDRPRKVNPRIPQDLGTVIEVAMDVDPRRRYATALEFAEDLRRVRSFEPILARPASVWTRTSKWVKRKPAPAVGLFATGAFVVLAAVFLVQRDLAESRTFRKHVADAEAAVEVGDPEAAFASLALARDMRPDAPQVYDLGARADQLRDAVEREQRRKEAFAAAAAAREESVAHQRQYADDLGRLQLLDEELEKARAGLFGSYADPDERARFAERERERRRLAVASEGLLLDARESLERAARFEAPWGISDATRVAFASFFLSRWREAVAEADVERAQLYQAAVESYDIERNHRDELLGRGTLVVDVTPPNAEVHLYRYEPYSELHQGDDVPRSVPTPTDGLTLFAEVEGFDGLRPGDPCLVVESVHANSPAARAGLAPGDLIVAVQGQRAAESVFLQSLPAAAGDVDAVLPTRVTAIEGETVRGMFDVSAVWPPDLASASFSLAALEQPLPVGESEASLTTGTGLVARGYRDGPLTLACRSDGRRVDLELAAGEASGLHCRTTAYPLFPSDANRVPPSNPLTLEPGSYLLVASAPGHDPLRVPIVVDRLAEVRRELRLLPEGSTPPGFVYVPPATATLGGDPLAREPLPYAEQDLPGYFIQRYEIRNDEWNEFLADPAIAARIAASETPILVPREPSRRIPEENLGGPSAPVMGISWTDVAIYLEWRNARAEANGEPWVYDLPSESEWEWAARGPDGRAYPWGSRFDYAATTGMHSRARAAFDAPCDIEPRDESPFGVYNLGGLRNEWTRDAFVPSPDAPPMYRVCGGSWRSSRAQDFRAASRGYAVATYVGGNSGARLVARFREDQ